MLRPFISTFTLLVLVNTFAIAQIMGKVYLDRNENGRQDPGEKGIAGVMVQDGLNVVITAADGTFCLPGHKKVRFIALTPPDGFQASPCHYVRYEGTDKTYQLGLCRAPLPAAGAYSFIQIADTETSLYGDWIDNLKEYVKTNPTAFVIHTGDICYEAHQEFHGKYLRSADVGVPVYYCVGNHDLREGKYGEELWESYFGPVWYSFEVGNVHYIVTPMLGGDHTPSYRREDLVRWLQNDLKLVAKDKKVVLFNHDLWFGEDHMIFKDNKGRQIDFAEYGLEAVIYGHWHCHYYKQLKTGLKTFCSSTPDKGGIDHGTSCFRVYQVGQQGDLSSETRYSYVRGELAAVCPAEGETLVCPDGKMNVRANAYRTVSRTKRVTAVVEQNGKNVSSVVLSPETGWAWSGKIRVRDGKQRLRITAEFEDGTVLTRRVDYRISFDTPEVCEKEVVWAGLRGNAAHHQVVEKQVSLPLQTRWVRNAGGNVFMCSPVIAGGKVFVATIDDDNGEKCGVKAFNESDGKLCWTVKTSNSVKNTIVYENGRIFAVDATGFLYAIDAEQGTVCWKMQLPVPFLPPVDEGLAVDHGVVYAGQGSGICAVRAGDGKILWKNEAWSGGEGTTSTFTVGDRVLVASAHWNGLFGHDVENGSLLWKKRDSQMRFRDGSATYYDGNFYLASSDRIYMIHPRSGEVLKTTETAYRFNSAAAPLVTDQYLVVATSDKGIVAFDRLTFKEVWNYRTGPAMFYTVPYTHKQECSVELSPVLIGDILVFGASDGYLHAVDLDTGTYRGKRALGAPVFSSIAVGGNSFYVTDFAGNLYCFLLDN